MTRKGKWINAKVNAIGTARQEMARASKRIAVSQWGSLTIGMVDSFYSHKCTQLFLVILPSPDSTRAPETAAAGKNDWDCQSCHEKVNVRVSGKAKCDGKCAGECNEVVKNDPESEREQAYDSECKCEPEPEYANNKENCKARVLHGLALLTDSLERRYHGDKITEVYSVSATKN